MSACVRVRVFCGCWSMFVLAISEDPGAALAVQMYLCNHFLCIPCRAANGHRKGATGGNRYQDASSMLSVGFLRFRRSFF